MFDNYKVIEDSEEWRKVRSYGYNYNFSKITGKFARWGTTFDDDPLFAPAPEILDIEISTVCDNNCAYCYKDNDLSGEWMPLTTYESILKKLPSNVTQIALGIGKLQSEVKEYIDLTRKYDIVPNITISSSSSHDKLSLLEDCGAVSITVYSYIDYYLLGCVKSYNLNQVNFHIVADSNFFQSKLDLLKYIASNNIQEFINAIVFLGLKKKGRAVNRSKNFTSEQWKEVFDFCIDKDLPIGMDSCSAPQFLKWAEERGEIDKYLPFVEPCESGLFSLYINILGQAFPCSFMEGEKNWETGIDVNRASNFIKDVWMHPRLVQWKKDLLFSTTNCDCKYKSSCRTCPRFDMGCKDFKMPEHLEKYR